MTTITPEDAPKVAAQIRVAGELMDVHLGLVLSLLADWSAGAKAANLDPNSRGNRWDAENEAWIPSDPTGEAMLNARADTAVEAQMRLERMRNDALWWRDMIHVAGVVVPPSTINAKDDLWCTRCLRVGICEPRHRGTLCRDCDDFKKLYQADRPFSLVRMKREGKRLTKTIVEDALRAEGLILEEVGGVTKAVKAARGSTGRPNQNQKKRAS